MIDDKKIEESAEYYSDENSMYIDHPMGDTYIMEKLSDAYKAGAKWMQEEFLKNLWHPTSEKPISNMNKCNLNLKKYIGTKVVEAKPMNEIDAESIGYARKNSDHHEWREGYHVRYTNPDGSFYDSWSPKDVFEEAYRIADSHKDRIKMELSNIADKLIKLRNFLYVRENSVDTVGVHQYSLMVAQEHIMQSYKDILEEQLSFFENTCSENSSIKK